MTVHVPPLRDRVAEIPSLAGVLLERACARAGRAPLGIDADALALLSAYRWPGNVRELRNVVERAVILCDDVVVRPAHLVFDPAPPPPGGPASLAPPPPPSVVPSAPASAGAPPAADLSPADAAERERILAALDRTAGNQTEAAKLLGVTRRMLAYRLDKLGVRRPRKG
jgi:DNA-binding NtrC family response regulator